MATLGFHHRRFNQSRERSHAITSQNSNRHRQGDQPSVPGGITCRRKPSRGASIAAIDKRRLNDISKTIPHKCFKAGLKVSKPVSAQGDQKVSTKAKLKARSWQTAL
jgi:hypothetical protein